MTNIDELYDIPDFTGYKASKDGDIYSMIPKGCRNRFDQSKWLEVPKKLAVRETKNGYCRVYMRRDSTGKREDVYIHRIIARIFIPNPNNLEQINHKDCNRKNNNVENLEWVSQYQNWEYAQTNGFQTRNSKGQFCHNNMV